MYIYIYIRYVPTLPPHIYINICINKCKRASVSGGTFFLVQNILFFFFQNVYHFVLRHDRKLDEVVSQAQGGVISWYYMMSIIDLGYFEH